MPRKLARQAFFHLLLITNTLQFEVECGCHNAAFMISSQKEDLIGIEFFEKQKQRYGFNAKLASVHIVSQKEVFSVWYRSETIKNVQ